MTTPPRPEAAMPALDDTPLPPPSPCGHPPDAAAAPPVAVADADVAGFHHVVALLSARAGIAFEAYKTATLIRRARQRMRRCHVATFGEYAAYLRRHEAELDALFADVLIGVTSFFRDAAAWECLQLDVIAPLVHNQPADRPIRVWVPGCATGEEAYSVAMLLLEEQAAGARPVPIRIFASDVDEKAIARARAGRYERRTVASLPAARVARFFQADGTGLRVAPALRQCIVFARHDVIKDPPYGHLDLITCRNLLMYLEPTTQERVLERFHFALRPEGCLFLGNGEVIGRRSDLFAPLSRRWRIYRRR
jgi:two-component system CheB/CheR fusion protein